MQISDPTAIRALAHPLRLDLLKVLGAHGSATAAQCGRALGASQASCSFHLRQLAKYGLVEDAGPGSDRRERRWRVPQLDTRLTVRIADGSDAVVRRRIHRLTVEQEMQAILDYSERPDGASPEWRHKAGIVTWMAALSPEDAADIKEKWIALLAPYIARARAAGHDLQPGQQLVRCFMALTPLTEIAETEGEDEQGD
jgi:DNA-binding transcriptional ArsR family regulator